MSQNQVTIKGKVVNFNNALPLKVRDWKALKDVGVTIATIRSFGETMDLDAISALVIHVLKKVDASITLDDVQDLTLDEIVDVALAIVNRSGREELDRPT